MGVTLLARPHHDTAAQRRSGVLLVVLSGACFGTIPVLAKVAYRDGAQPLFVLTVRFTIAGALLLALTWLHGRRTGRRFPRGRLLLLLVLLGGVGYVVESMAYFYAVQRTSAALAAILLYLYPGMVVALARLLFREAVPPTTALALLVAVAGAALVVGPVSGGALTGAALAVASAVAYAVYIVASSQVVPRVGALAATAVVMSSAGVVFTAVSLGVGARGPHSPAGWMALLALAVVATVVAAALFFAGLVRVGPADTATVSTVEPVTSVLLAAVVLDERLTPLQVLGGVLVLAAVVVVARGRRPGPAQVSREP